MDRNPVTRVRIIHVSDWHLRVGATLSKNLVDPLVKAVSAAEGEPDHQILALTGDIANSGEKSEYAVASEIVRGLQTGLKKAINAPLTTLIVPGNHDCNFRLDSAARKAVLKSTGPKSDWDPSIPEICTSVQSDFFSFANSVENSSLRWSPNNLITSTRIAHANHAISFWGINSAWMSQIKEEPGSIWFPHQLLQAEIEKAEPAFNVLLLHHPFAWFTPETRRSFLTLVDSAIPLVVGGHEHLPEMWGREDMHRHRVLVVEGGAFQENPTEIKGSTFNLITLELGA